MRKVVATTGTNFKEANISALLKRCPFQDSCHARPFQFKYFCNKGELLLVLLQQRSTILHNTEKRMEQPRKRDKSKSKRKKSRETHAASALVVDDEAIRQTRMIRSAKKHEKQMAALGLDVNGEPLDNYSLTKYPVREYKLMVPGFQGSHIALNPVVNMLGIVVLWSIVAWTACTFFLRPRYCGETTLEQKQQGSR